MKSFNVLKTLQVLSYIQQKSGRTDMLSLLKYCFFADRKMLRTFGIPILDDKYFALKFGPVCSQTKNILQQDFDYLYVNKSDEELIKANVTITGAHDMKIAALNASSLSKAEKQVLDFVIDTFGSFSPFELVEITHDYPEWKRWENRLSATNQPQQMARLIHEIDNGHVFTTCDLYNYLYSGNYERREQIFEDCLKLLGKKIVIFHIKDFNVFDGVLKEVPIGDGIMGWDKFLPIIQQEYPHANLVFEGVPEKEKSLAFVKQVLKV